MPSKIPNVLGSEPQDKFMQPNIQIKVEPGTENLTDNSNQLIPSKVLVHSLLGE